MNINKVLFGIMTGVSSGAFFGIKFTSNRSMEVRKKMYEDTTRMAGVLKEKFKESLRHYMISFNRLFHKRR